MATVANLRVILTAHTRRFGTAMAKARRMLFSVKTAVLSLTGIGGFGLLAKSVTAQADQLGKLSTRLGESVENLSRLSFIAERSGVSTQTMALALQRMSRRVAEAAAGTGEAQGALEELNIDAKAFAKLKPAEQFQRLAEAMDGMPQGDRLRLAFKLFDSEGAAAFLQSTQDGAKGLQAMIDEFERLGGPVTEQQARAAEKIGDAWTNFTHAIRQNMLVVVGEASEDIIALIGHLKDAAVWIGEKLPAAIKTVRGWLDSFGESIDEINEDYLKPLGDFWERAFTQLKGAGDLALATFDNARALFGNDPNLAASAQARGNAALRDVANLPAAALIPALDGLFGESFGEQNHLIETTNELLIETNGTLRTITNVIGTARAG